MAIFDLIERDHNDILDVTKEIKNLESRLGSGVKEELLKLIQMLKAQVTIHTDIEEEVVYQAVQREEKENILILESYEEHELVARTLENALSNIQQDNISQGFAQICVVSDLLEHHMDEEENHMFDLLKEKFDNAQLEKMAATYENRMLKQVKPLMAS